MTVKVGGALPEGLMALLPREAAGTYRFRLTGFDQVESILAPLRSAGLHIEDLAIESPDLEDVFVQIMAGAQA